MGRDCSDFLDRGRFRDRLCNTKKEAALELDEALTRISEIRGHLARTEVCRGFRSLPIAISGVLAIAAGAAQPVLVPAPVGTPFAWLALWIATAGLSVALWASEVAWRYSHTTSSLERERMRLAVGRFAPSVAAGALVTLAFALRSPEDLHLLPGIWALLMSVGTFAALPLLPRPVLLVAAWYFLAGAAVFSFAPGALAFSPFAMGVVFGTGQLAAAAVMKLTLERRSHER